MKQLTLATVGFERYAETTRRAAFLAEMERVVPWPALCGLVEPCYPRLGHGRPPVGLERMLRIYFLQHWFDLSDPAAEEALYNSLAMCRFVGIDLGREPVPDETTMCRFRHLLEAHDLGRALFDEVQRHLARNGLRIATGTIVDATIIGAPSSTKNAAKPRDPEMRQTKKGNQWYFGMKAHLGVDSRSKLIHAVVATPAHVADSTVLPDLLHGKETKVWGDQAYQVEDPRQGRAHDRRHRARPRLRQGALSRPGEERSSPHRHLRARQPVHRPPASAAPPGGVACPYQAAHRPASPARLPTAPRSNPEAG